jgi:hypothetical protein
MTPQRPSHQPTLEELLRVKRAERPPQEFWKRFEDELRAKQLAAIVAPRSWWQPLVSLVPGRRTAALAGVGAAVAFSFAAYLRFPAAQAPRVTEPAIAAAPVAVPPTTISPPAVVPAPLPVAELAATVPEPTTAPETTAAPPVEPARAPSLAASLTSPVVVKFSEIQVPPPQATIKPALPAAGLVFAANLRTEANLPEPLAAIPGPREQRLARTANVAELAMMAVMPAATQVRTRGTPRDSDLRDREIGRLSAKGDRLGYNF